MASSYRDLATELAGRIASAELTVRLPSEHQLALEHGVSRLTARAALQELEQWHLVRRVQGAGTFVSPRLDYLISAQAPPSWHEAVKAAGHQPAMELLSLRFDRPPTGVARDLDLAPEEPVVRLDRRGSVDGLVATLGTSWLPAAVVPGWREALGSCGSLFDALRRHYGFQPVRRWCRAQLDAPPAEVARALGHQGRPLVWRLESLNRCARSGRLLERSEAWMRADTFRVRFLLEAGDR